MMSDEVRRALQELEAHQLRHINLDKFRQQFGRDPTSAEVGTVALTLLCDECERLKRTLYDVQEMAHVVRMFEERLRQGISGEGDPGKGVLAEHLRRWLTVLDGRQLAAVARVAQRAASEHSLVRDEIARRKEDAGGLAAHYHGARRR